MAGSSKEARLILRLIDQVSGPARAIASSLGAVNTTAKALTSLAMAPTRALGGLARSARNSAYNTSLLSAPILLGAGAAAKSVFQFEKLGNTFQAVGLMSDEQREKIEKFAFALNEKYPFTNNEIMQAAVELSKAGLTFEQSMGALPNALNFAQAGDIPLKDSAEYLVQIATAMRLPLKTAEETEATMKRVADAIAYGAAASTADVSDIATTMSYVAPIAAATGQSLEEMTNDVIALANNGIKATKAGTGLRFALLRILNPSKQASKALARLGIDLKDYVTGARKITGKDVIGLLKMDGIDASGLEKQIDAALNDPAIMKSPAKLVGRLTEEISDALGTDRIIDKDSLANNLSDILTVVGTKIDLRGLLNALRANPDAEALFGQIFGKHHAAKIMALLANDLDDSLEKMQREYVNAADRMAKIRMKGIVGDWYRLRAAVDNFTIGLSRTGVLATVTNSIRAMTKAITDLGNLNPKILEFGTYGALAVAAIAPLGFAVSGIASALALAVNPLTWVVGGLGALAALNFDKIVAFGRDFGASFKSNLDPAVIEAFAAGLDKLKSAWSSLNSIDPDGAGWGARAAHGLNATYDAIQKFMQNNTVRAFGSMVGGWFDMLGSAGAAAVRILFGLGRGIAAFGTAFAENLAPGATGAMVSAAQAVFGAIGSFAHAAADWLDKISVDLSGFGARAGKWAADAVNRIYGAFSGIDLSAIGRRIIESLLSGLAAAAGKLYDFAAGVGRKIADMLHISGSVSVSSGVDPNPVREAEKRGLKPEPVIRSSIANENLPPRAAGGPIRRGLTYEINERGRETITIGTNGYVTRAGQTGGPTVTVGPVSIYGVNAQEVMAKLDNTISRALERSRQISLMDVPVTT